MRLLVVLVPLLTLLANASGDVLLAQPANCVPCAPIHDGVHNLSGNYTVQIEWSNSYQYPSGQISEMKNAIEGYWNGYFQALGINISFSVSDCNVDVGCGSADIRIFLDDPVNFFNQGALAETLQTSDGHGSSVRVDRTQLSNINVHWSHMGAHEVGHVLGFDNVSNSECALATIMFIPNRPMLSSVGCGDKIAVSDHWLGQTYYSDDYQWIHGSADCYEVWRTTYYFCSDDGIHFYQCGEVGPVFSHFYCGEPPV